MNYTLCIDRPSEQVIPHLVSALQHQGLRATLSFDLQVARAGQEKCDCPHHGTEPCTCQYAILLVNDPARAQRVSHTITIHGRDGRVWLSLLKQPASSTQAAPAHKAQELKLMDILLALAAEFREPVLDTSASPSVALRTGLNTGFGF